jgi:hypothetical protein
MAALSFQASEGIIHLYRPSMQKHANGVFTTTKKHFLEGAAPCIDI